MKEYSMADFIIKNDGSYACIEVDSLLEFNLESRFVSSANEAGISLKILCNKIIELALSDKK